jgi:hypothetical protein
LRSLIVMTSRSNTNRLPYVTTHISRDSSANRHARESGSLPADTPRLSSLNEQYGEQEVFRDRRNGQRDEGAPLLQREHRDLEYEAWQGREH